MTTTTRGAVRLPLSDRALLCAEDLRPALEAGRLGCDAVNQAVARWTDPDASGDVYRLRALVAEALGEPAPPEPRLAWVLPVAVLAWGLAAPLAVLRALGVI